MNFSYSMIPNSVSKLFRKYIFLPPTLIFIVGHLVVFIFAYQFKTVESLNLLEYIDFVTSHADGTHYKKIAEGGYSETYMFAFFPLFPLEIRFFNFLLRNTSVSAFVVSYVNFLFLYLTIYAFLKKYLKNNKVKVGTLISVTLPFSVFFIIPYTEALFIALQIAILFLLFYKKEGKLFFLLPLLTFLISLTRSVSITVLLGGLFYLIISLKLFRIKNILNILRESKSMLVVVLISIITFAIGFSLQFFILYIYPIKVLCKPL